MTTTDTVIIHVQEYNTVGEVQTGVSLHPDGTMQTVCGDFARPHYQRLDAGHRDSVLPAVHMGHVPA